MSVPLYDQPALYDMLFGRRRGDLPFYLGLAAEVGGAVLELGIGTGRVGLTLARQGYDVTGVELSGEMLDVLAARVAEEPPEVQGRLQWRRGDARAIDLGRTFELVICPFNGLAHFHTEAELTALLANVARHLAPEGTFALDLLIPDPTLLRGESSYVPWFRDPRTGEVSRAQETTRYDRDTGVLTITTEIRSLEREGEAESLTLRLRQYFPHETPGLLRRHGFRVVRQDPSLGDVVGYVCRRGSSPNRPRR